MSIDAVPKCFQSQYNGYLKSAFLKCIQEDFGGKCVLIDNSRHVINAFKYCEDVPIIGFKTNGSRELFNLCLAFAKFIMDHNPLHLEKYWETPRDDKEFPELYNYLKSHKGTVILSGKMGSGKSSIAGFLSREMGRPAINPDAPHYVVKNVYNFDPLIAETITDLFQYICGKSLPLIITTTNIKPYNNKINRGNCKFIQIEDNVVKEGDTKICDLPPPTIGELINLYNSYKSGRRPFKSDFIWTGLCSAIKNKPEGIMLVNNKHPHCATLFGSKAGGWEAISESLQQLPDFKGIFQKATATHYFDNGYVADKIIIYIKLGDEYVEFTQTHQTLKPGKEGAKYGHEAMDSGKESKIVPCDSPLIEVMICGVKRG